MRYECKMQNANYKLQNEIQWICCSGAGLQQMRDIWCQIKLCLLCIFVQIVKLCIYTIYIIHTMYICPNCKAYLSKVQNVFVNIVQKLQKISDFWCQI